MANEIYLKSWWGSGVCDNDINWGLVYKPYANCAAPRDPSFVEKFGEPISAYSLRNLTSNTEQFVIQVSNGEKTFDLLETQVADRFYLNELGKNLRVVKWYDQAGTDQTLIALEPFAPYLVKDGVLSAPINFGFGEGINMLMTEFIIYPDETENVEDVTDNILEYYKIISFPPIEDEPGFKPKK